MTSFDYAVLGFAESEHLVDSIPFAVFTLSDRTGSAELRGNVLREWMSLDRIGSTDIENIAGFLEDSQISSEGTAEDVQYFWAELVNLSVGPMRTISTGHCDGSNVGLVEERPLGIAQIEGEALSALLLQLKECLPKP